LELLDQPAKRIAYTLNEEIANVYKTPKLIFETTTPSSKGITTHPIILNTKANQGANE
jgi:hypothetical protein